MKSKLILMGLVMALGGWMAVGDSPRARSLEQRVAELERLVLMQQQQLDRLAALADVMEVLTLSDGSKSLQVRSTYVVFEGSGFAQVNDLIVTGNLYHYGSLVQLP